MKRILLIFLCLGLAFAAATLVWQRYSAQSEQQAAFEKAKAERAAELERLRLERRALAPIVFPIPEPDPAKTRPKPKLTTASTDPAAQDNSTDQLSSAASQTSTVLPPAKLWQDPLARMALSLVGDDDVAEAIWVRAINNPDLPPKERK